jgi:hypothetical protein
MACKHTQHLCSLTSTLCRQSIGDSDTQQQPTLPFVPGCVRIDQLPGAYRPDLAMASTSTAEPEALPPSSSDAPATEDSAQQGNDEARYIYDESLLIKVKGSVRKPPKPDENERNLAVDKLRAEIDRRSARIAEIKATIDNAKAARAAGRGGNAEALGRIKALGAEFRTVLVGWLQAVTGFGLCTNSCKVVQAG